MDKVERCRAVLHQHFQKLLTWVSFSDRQQLRFDSHRATVTGRLKSSFQTSDIIVIGSSSRGSAIPQVSDLDLLVVLRSSETRRAGQRIGSDTILGRVRRDLQERFWRTRLGKDGQAIVLDFGGGEQSVDVVPGFFDGMWEGCPIYSIPDGVNDWKKTSPRIHGRYLSQADDSSRGKLKNIARMMKYWAWSRRSGHVELRSFYLELLIAAESICVGPKRYGECLREVFKNLARRSCRSFRDPTQVAGLITLAGTNARVERTLLAIQDSAGHADRAIAAEEAGDLSEAIRQWDIVFNGGFPKTV